MDETPQELQEARRQIASTVHKLEAALQSLEQKAEPRRYKSQITLARRRIQAFRLALKRIDREAEQEETP